VVWTLGVDEHKMLAAGPRHRSVFATELVDLDTGALLDVIPGRNARSVSAWLEGKGPRFCDQVAGAAIDPLAGHQRAIRISLSAATITVDPFP